MCSMILAKEADAVNAAAAEGVGENKAYSRSRRSCPNIDSGE